MHHPFSPRKTRRDYLPPPELCMPPVSIFSATFLRRVLRGAIVGAKLAAGPSNLSKLRRAFDAVVVTVGVAVVVSWVLYLVIQKAAAL